MTTNSRVIKGEVFARPDDGLQLRAERLSEEIERRAEDSRAAIQGGPTLGSDGGDGLEIPWTLDPAATTDFYLSSPWLAAVGNLLSDAVSSADVELSPRRFTPDGRPITGKASPEEEAAALAWLNREDFGLDGVSQLDFSGFLKAHSSYYDTNGNIFVEVGRNDKGDAPERLITLLPQFVRYVTGGKGTRLRQTDPYSGGNVHYVRFGQREQGDNDVREFLHERRSSLVSSVYGVPPWIEARKSAEVDNSHREYLKGFFGNHAAPRWAITVTDNPEWEGDKVDEKELGEVYSLVRSYLEANRGAMAGRNLLMQIPGSILVKVEPLDVKIEDPTFKDTARNMRDEILAVRHVSLVNLGLPEGGYRATAGVQDEAFRKHVLIPFSDPVVRLVNRVLHAPAPYGLGIEHWDLALDFKNVSEVLETLKGIKEATGTPVLTPDEGRDLAKYEKRGIDRIYAPAGVAPLEQEGDDPDSPAPGRGSTPPKGKEQGANVELDEEPDKEGPDR